MHARLTAAAIALLIGAALMSPAAAQSSESAIFGNQIFDFGKAAPSPPKKRKFRGRASRKSSAETVALEDPPLPEPNPARLAGDGASGTQTAASGPPAGTATDAFPVETGTVAAPVDTGPVPCRKYDATTGRTIEVRCR